MVDPVLGEVGFMVLGPLEPEPSAGCPEGADWLTAAAGCCSSLGLGLVPSTSGHSLLPEPLAPP